MAHPGNDPAYDLSLLPTVPDSPLRGKRICFLGSSVTLGAASGEVSFVDYLAKRHEAICVKYAVSGTTLADRGPESYISRLRRIESVQHFDLFACQLSTNDATQGIPLPEVTAVIDTIASHVGRVWGCPLLFWTNPRYDSPAYAAMVTALRARTDILLLDLWSDEAFNAVSAAERDLWLADPIHPTRAGYLQWWMPRFEEAILRILSPVR